jgi:hypothetical protein
MPRSTRCETSVTSHSSADDFADTARAAALRFEREMWLAIERRDGREVWWASYRSKAEALEAAGLRE